MLLQILVNDQLGAVPINNPLAHHDHHDHDGDHHDHNEEDSQVNEETRSGAHPTHPSLDGFDLNARAARALNGKINLPPLLKRAAMTPLFQEK